MLACYNLSIMLKNPSIYYVIIPLLVSMVFGLKIVLFYISYKYYSRPEIQP
jgi:hypothetical protein